MPQNITRRAVLAALPVGCIGLVAGAKSNLITASDIPQRILDRRQFEHALNGLVAASNSAGLYSLIAFAQHVSALSEAGDREAIRASVVHLIDRLYQEHNIYNETRETWLAENSGCFYDEVDSDDPSLSEAMQDEAVEREGKRHQRRSRANA